MSLNCIQRYKPIVQVPKCTNVLSHNAPFCNTHVIISVTKWFILRYCAGALWDFWNGTTTHTPYNHVRFIELFKLTILIRHGTIKPTYNWYSCHINNTQTSKFRVGVTNAKRLLTKWFSRILDCACLIASFKSQVFGQAESRSKYWWQ